MGWYVVLSMYFLIILVEIFLGFYLMYMLKNYLNYYYKNKRNKIIILTVLSVVYFTLRSIMYLDWKYFRFDSNIIALKDDIFSHTTSEVVIAFVLNIAFNIPVFIFAFFHIYIQDFKLYLSHILQGHRINLYFNTASIFVIPKPNPTNSVVSCSTSDDSVSIADDENEREPLCQVSISIYLCRLQKTMSIR